MLLSNLSHFITVLSFCYFKEITYSLPEEYFLILAVFFNAENKYLFLSDSSKLKTSHHAVFLNERFVYYLKVRGTEETDTYTHTFERERGRGREGWRERERDLTFAYLLPK